MTYAAWDLLISNTKPVGRDLSIVTKVLYGAVPAVGLAAMSMTAVDAAFGVLLPLTAVATGIAGAYPTLETLWRRGRRVPAVFIASAAALVLIPVLVTMALMELIYLLPPVQAQVDTVEWFERHPAIYPLAGYIAGLLGAMAIFIVILMPVMILRGTDLAFAEWGVKPGTPHTRVEFLLGLVLILVVVGFAIGMTFEMLYLSIPCAVAAVVLIIALRRIQKSRG